MALKYKKDTLKKWLPVRSRHSNKTDGGVVLIVAGGARYKGAGILSALAATRSGAGYTHLMTDLVKFPWLSYPDFIVHKIALRELKNHRESVITIGPGLGVSEITKKFLKFLIQKKISRVVIDADALTMLAKMKIKKLPATWILTPHEGELARLLGIPSIKIKKERENFLIKAYKKYGCTILLKGADTLIINEGEVSVVSSGTKALAKAGTGDVLLGVIAALYAQGLTPLHSALLGSFIHGEASKDWQKQKNDHLSMRPMDLIEQFPKTIYRLRK